MAGHVELLRDTVGALQIHSRSAYSWFGARHTHRRVREQVIDPFAWLRRAIQWRLYQDFYCPGAPRPTSTTRNSDVHTLSGWTAALSRSNRGRGCPDPGWTVVGTERRHAIVHKNGLTLTVPLTMLSRGDSSKVTVRLPHEYLGLAPGFYMAASDAPVTDPLLMRTYLHLDPSAAPVFVRYATAFLNDRAIPFRLKVAADPASFSRSDAVVLYVAKHQWREAYELIERLRRVRRIRFSGTVPALTKRIARGVGVAEQPPSEESFGQHRMAILANALLATFQRDEQNQDSRFAVVAKHFEANGIDLARPYLNAGSRDIYPCLD